MLRQVLGRSFCTVRPMSAAKTWTKKEIQAANTFALQDQLSSLPLPSLEETCTRYLRAVRPLVSADEYAKTKSIAQEYFASTQAHEAQEHLAKRAESSRNWLEEWWNSLAYLKFREPLIPYLNFGGISTQGSTSPHPGSQLDRAAFMGWLGSRFWYILYREKFPVMHTNKPVPLCMDQFGTLFATTRNPRATEDAIRKYFRTYDEEQVDGSVLCPTHITVQYRGHYYQIDVYDRENDKLIDFWDMYDRLQWILRATGARTKALGALTCLPREDWMTLRNKVQEVNAAELEAVESSLFMLSLTDESPKDEDEMNWYALTGPAGLFWADKSFIWMIHKNGLVASNADHSPNEAMVTVAMTVFVDSELDRLKYHPPPRKGAQPLLAPQGFSGEFPVQKLNFTIGEQFSKEITKAENSVAAEGKNLEVTIFRYDGFSRPFCKEHGLIVDPVIQLAIQAAYFKAHSKFVATYETASTKQFYHGRSETMKSATIEACEFAKSLATGGSDAELFKKFKVAYDVHNQQMRTSQDGFGVDRHLLGLRVQSALLGQPDPPIFADPAYIKQGGDANYIVSTSFLGSTTTYGGVTPMVRHGYGSFYKATDGEMTFFLSRWKDSQETNLYLLKDSLQWSLDRVREMISAGNAKL